MHLASHTVRSPDDVVQESKHVAVLHNKCVDGNNTKIAFNRN
jgi:hypothetical protein